MITALYQLSYEKKVRFRFQPKARQSKFVFRIAVRNLIVLEVGFEPTQPKLDDLKSSPLDLSGIQAMFSLSLSHQCG